MELGTVSVAETWKGLPQELVKRVLERIGIAQGLFVGLQGSVCFDPPYHSPGGAPDAGRELGAAHGFRDTHIRGDGQGIGIRALSRIAAHGLLPYARHHSTHLNRNLTPRPPNFIPTVRLLHLDTPAGDARDRFDSICQLLHLSANAWPPDYPSSRVAFSRLPCIGLAPHDTAHVCLWSGPWGLAYHCS